MVKNVNAFLAAPLALVLLILLRESSFLNVSTSFWATAPPAQHRKVALRSNDRLNFLGMVGKIANWTGEPGTSFRALESECIIKADNTFHYDGGLPLSEVPFLFDEKDWPWFSKSCRHCESSKPSHCCGVCIFNGYACRMGGVMKGENMNVRSSELVAKHIGKDALHSFLPCELFSKLRGHTLWFIGDHHMAHFYFAVECFLREFAPTLIRSYPIELGGMGSKEPVASTDDPAPMCMQLGVQTRLCFVYTETLSQLQRTILPNLYPHNDSEKERDSRDLLLWSPSLSGYQQKVDQLASDLDAFLTWTKSMKVNLPRLYLTDAPPHMIRDNITMKCTMPVPGENNPAQVFNTLASKALLSTTAVGRLEIHDITIDFIEAHAPKDCSVWCSPSAYHAWIYLLNELLKRQ